MGFNHQKPICAKVTLQKINFDMENPPCVDNFDSETMHEMC